MTKLLILKYLMLCGTLPFEADSHSDLYKKIIGGKFTLPSFLSMSAKDLIRKILVTLPKKRYKISQIKKHEWFKLNCNNEKEKYYEGINLKNVVIPIDEGIVKDMEQIGFETMGLFKQKVKISMKEIMESKLPLIYSASIQYDPLVNVDFTETMARTIESEGNSSGLNVGSDTPQGQISKQSILQGNYATGTSASEGEAQNNSEENYTKKVKGNSGVSATAQRMVQQYRDNIRAIDYEIIKELENLFMIIY